MRIFKRTRVDAVLGHTHSQGMRLPGAAAAERPLLIDVQPLQRGRIVGLRIVELQHRHIPAMPEIARDAAQDSAPMLDRKLEIHRHALR